ncbi:SGNH/GDSL hydrolase family protein [Paenibacillus sp. PR3]|uniref:SGNH/GDSL hydrolase family protein n=1 Tax=Paenibacillus terricola TaxID=2763503 RepID=A0ABR8MW56_9BACL|nr:SGNH/GDSL hydrolase family protein [Paenibacillus terricola]MBD3920133.1 SGNH/GDSL hydrolase family protein [Paenibacillus terricola]
MELQIWNQRGSLTNMKRAIEEGELTLGFIGGSITDARPRHNWPEPVIAWFVDTYPNVRIVVENAAIGATGSDLAVFRAKRDLIDRGCNLVFVDYAVNDNEVPTERRMRTREGLLRKLLEDGTRDVVLVHTFSQDMCEPMMAGEQPPSVAELEVLAEHYGIGSVWMGLYAMRQVQRGLMRWEEWLPDNLHPTSRGSLAYGESVIHYLKQELAPDKASVELREDRQLAEPMNPLHWGDAVTLPLTEVQTSGPWTIRRWPYYEWVDRVLDTAAPGARLTIPFVGRGIALGVDFGKATAEIRYRLDGGDWRNYELDRPDWNGNDGWLRLLTISDELEAGAHQLELETFLGNTANNKGTNLRLAIIGIIA